MILIIASVSGSLTFFNGIEITLCSKSLQPLKFIKSLRLIDCLILEFPIN